MPTPATPATPTPRGDDRNPAPAAGTPVALSFEDNVRVFWEKNSKLVTGVLFAILLGIAAKGGWEYLEAQKERDIEQSYATATTPAQLKTFIAAHSNHPLAAVAQLHNADEAYAEGRFADAIAPYEQAAAVLKTGPLAARAALGVAMAKLQGGRAAEGEAALKAIANDPKGIKAFRAEAAYHLASHAFAAGNAADVKTYTDLLSLIDATSPWAQRALQLRALVPATLGTAPAAGAAITLPTGGK